MFLSGIYEQTRYGFPLTSCLHHYVPEAKKDSNVGNIALTLPTGGSIYRRTKKNNVDYQIIFIYLNPAIDRAHRRYGARWNGCQMQRLVERFEQGILDY